MEKDDEILEKLKALADEDIEIPVSLQPEKIRERLGEEDNKLDDTKRRRNMKHWLLGLVTAAGAVAAAFAIMIGSGKLNLEEMGIDGITSISDIVAGKQVNAKKQKKTAKKVDGIKQFKDYESLYKYLAKAAEKSINRNEFCGAVKESADTTATAPTQELSKSADQAVTEDSDGAGDYSKTNTRTEGVDEADIVKTDGKYIYVLKNRYDGEPGIKIIKADKGKMEAVSSRIALNRSKDGIEYYYSNIMLEGNTLVVFADGNIYYSGKYGYGRYREKSITEILFYDITNPEKPVLKAKHTQEGSVGNTRMKDGIIYTFSHSYNLYYYPVTDKENIKYNDLIPEVDGKKIGIKSIYVPEYSSGDCYTVVTSIDVKNPDKVIDSKLIMDSGYDIYVSNDNIYFWNSDYYMSSEKTKIMKYSYKDGIITPQASASVLGNINNDYSLDEYKGNLRLVITKGNNWFGIMPIGEPSSAEDSVVSREETTENALYIFDKDLKVKGKIEGLAKGEHIKSARFMGDMAYFVTFRQTDPLFSVDVSDPANPKILGYLKIPGFSEYLHPFGNGLLFGLGQDADEKVGGTKGLKLSMFDISNPADVKEIAKKLFNERDEDYSNSEAEYERKSILVDAAKNLMGFPVSYYSSAKRRQINQYVIYGFDKEKGFYERFRADFPEFDSYGGNYRGLYIGKHFYIVAVNIDEVLSFDMKTGQLVEKLDY